MIIHLIRTRLVAADNCNTYSVLVPIAELSHARAERITYRTIRSTPEKRDVPHADLSDVIAPPSHYDRLVGIQRYRDWQSIEAAAGALEFDLLKAAFPELRGHSRLQPIMVFEKEYPTAEFVAECPLDEGAFITASDPGPRAVILRRTAIRPVSSGNDVNAALLGNPPAFVTVAWRNPDTGAVEPDLLSRDDHGRYVDENGLVHAQSIDQLSDEIIQVWQTADDHQAWLEARKSLTPRTRIDDVDESAHGLQCHECGGDRFRRDGPVHVCIDCEEGSEQEPRRLMEEAAHG